jgi:serine/threonine-protein kinase
MDAELALVQGRILHTAARFDEATREFDRALAIDPDFALAWWAKGVLAEDREDLEGARAGYESCLSVSRVAATCLRAVAAIRVQSGACEALEADARRMIAIEPNAPRGYEYLARSLASSGRPMAAVRRALETAWALYPGEVRRRHEAFDTARLDMLAGDLAAAEMHLAELDALVSSEPDESQHAGAARMRALLSAEMGQAERAGEIGARFLEEREAWFPATMGRDLDPYAAGALPVLLGFARRARLVSPAASSVARDAWLSRARAANPAAPELWYAAFAEPAETAHEAREALDALPAYAPLATPQELSTGRAAEGRVLLLAGKIDDALSSLRRGAAACLAFDAPIEQTRAQWFLGSALERKGDVAGACAAYATVLARWGAAKPRSVSADAARARVRALACER